MSSVNTAYDRCLGKMIGLPDTLATAPTTIRAVVPLSGESQTFIIQTFRQREEGDTVFLEFVAADVATRIMLPPDVTRCLARHRDTLTDRARRKAARAAAADRKARGIRPAFLKPKR